jgi:hypothetical protein
VSESADADIRLELSVLFRSILNWHRIWRLRHDELCYRAGRHGGRGSEWRTRLSRCGWPGFRVSACDDSDASGVPDLSAVLCVLEREVAFRRTRWRVEYGGSHMDPERFDAMTRRIATDRSRRAVLKASAAAALSGALVLVHASGAEAGKRCNVSDPSSCPCGQTCSGFNRDFQRICERCGNPAVSVGCCDRTTGVTICCEPGSTCLPGPTCV